MDMLHPVLEEMVAETIHKIPKEKPKHSKHCRPKDQVPFMLDWQLAFIS